MYKIAVSLCVCAFLVSCGNTPEQKNVVPEVVSSGSVISALSLHKEVNSEIQPVLEKKSLYVLSLLQKSDFSALASVVHPEQGLLLSADTYFDDTTFPRRTLQRKELAGFLTNTTTLTWGRNGYSETPIQMTGKDFWETRLYTKRIAQNVPRAYDDVLVTDMNKEAAVEAIQKKFPGSHFVEYKVVATADEREWSLRLVFNEYKGQWYLSGIVRDQFIN